uniref:G_PROTEIN_RECEP_F1_2 domain-containing protein n=1 Tax=Parastrongyloides trichosuri TaxID=131310 RepID=A0A0N4ZA01_PARTI
MFDDSILVSVNVNWIRSAYIYGIIPLIFYIINTIIIILTNYNKTLRDKKDLANILKVSAYINIFSMLIYSSFAYIWWYCYLTEAMLNVKVASLISEIRLVGMSTLFISPLILSIWRFFLIVKNWNIDIRKFCFVYFLLLSFHVYALCDKAFISKKIQPSDIYTYSIRYSSKLIVFLFLIPDILSPIFAIIFSIILLIYVKKHQENIKDAMSAKVKNQISRQQRILAYSLIIMSGIPLLGAIPHYLMRIFYFNGFYVPRIAWNVAEFIILFVGGSAPLMMILFLPTLKNAFLIQLSFKVLSITETTVKKFDNDVTKVVVSGEKHHKERKMKVLN